MPSFHSDIPQIDVKDAKHIINYNLSMNNKKLAEYKNWILIQKEVYFWHQEQPLRRVQQQLLSKYSLIIAYKR